MKIKILFVWIITCFLVVALNTSRADDSKVFKDVDFQKVSLDAKTRKLPVLVLFSSGDCDYCEVIIDEFIKPMLKSGDYVDKTIIRVVDIDDGEDVRDFNGKLIDSDSFADRYGIELTPTITFFDAQGREISQRITGIGTLDLYGGYLDSAIEMSLNIIRGS